MSPDFNIGSNYLAQKTNRPIRHESDGAPRLERPDKMSHSSVGMLKRRKFNFERFGKTYHLKIESFKDLEAVLELDEAQWVATTALTATLNCDEVFLSLMDTDNDGRLRAEEVKDAIRFLFENLSDRSGITPDNTHLNLEMIDTRLETGKRIHSSASKIMTRMKAPEPYVTLEQVRAIKTEVLDGGLDEAGMVLPEAAEDDHVRKFLKDILATVGGKPHTRGDQGVDDASLELFLKQCRQHLDWLKQANPAGEKDVSKILPLGPSTHEAYELFDVLENKITQFFLLCSIQQLNPELLVRAISAEDGSLAINVLDLTEAKSYLADAPLAAPNDEKILSLTGNGNPYYSRKLKRFTEIAIGPLLGLDVKKLDQTEWRKLREQFLPYRDWRALKPDGVVEKLSPEKMEQYIADPIFADGVKTLIEKSHQTAFVLDNIREVERFILYQANILPLVNSFVSFPNLYDPGQRALFEMGTLVMDGRHFTLAVKVLDRERHVESSTASNIFVMYLEVYGHNKEKLYEVAVPVTSGDRGNIRLNKWGIFNHVNGLEYHARVVQIIENPISIFEAMIHPFVRVAQSFMQRLDQVSAKTEEKISARVSTGDSKKKDDAGKKQKKEDGTSAGLLAGGGVAFAALGSSVAFIAQTFAKLNLKIIIGTVVAVILALVVPATISTYYKLSKRDLSAILEGSGWGVNARMKLTKKQASTFTHRPDYLL